MRYLVNASEMKTYDRYTIEKIGIPSLVLMERAGLETFRRIQKSIAIDHKTTALILVGYGNNGGDGLVLARLLCEAGADVTVWPLGSLQKATREWLEQKRILESFSVRFVAEPEHKSYSIIADALFGVGLTRKPEGIYESAIKMVNELEGFKVALDLPSGVSADDGFVPGVAFQADLTVTYGFEKRGLYLFPGSRFAGEIELCDVGIPQISVSAGMPEMFCIEGTLQELLPARKADGNKGNFGKALIIAGSKNMAGAAVLCARACYRTGCGMVKILTPECNREIIQKSIPEALLGTYDDLEESIKWCNAICIGPGIGTGNDAEQVMRRLLLYLSGYDCTILPTIPLLIDADGLNLIAGNQDLIAMLTKWGSNERRMKTVMTPHQGEHLRLLRSIMGEAVPDMDTIKRTPWIFGNLLSEKFGTVICVKDARSFICKCGEMTGVNIAGNSGMATAGSGDVLAGIITALMAAKVNVYESACRGVRIHALLGDICMAEIGEHALMAGDLVNVF